ncbi:MAG: diaminopimelate epimerase [Planctomycetota bacterium]|nr:diaminopimelate epimerase [Planctomycetota bacterium]
MSRSFVKMHGLGNDYVFLDGRDGSIPDRSIVRAVSDRRRGVGSDGVIVLQRPSNPENDARMIVFNADGSDGGVCGNGLRCLAAWLVGDGLIEHDSPRIEVGDGVVPSKLDALAESGDVLVSIELPPPRLTCAEIPARLPGVDDAAHVIGRPIGPGSGEAVPGVPLGRDASLTLVSTGNPHAVIWLGETPTELESLGDLVRSIGPVIERHAWFPARINVHVCCGTLRDRLRVATWERGSGPTRACGTGAAAVLVAAVLREGGWPVDRCEAWTPVQLPGGILENSWAGRPESPIRQRGPVTEVFRGSFDDSHGRF